MKPDLKILGGSPYGISIPSESGGSSSQIFELVFEEVFFSKWPIFILNSKNCVNL